MDDIVTTIQESWDGDVDARLSSQCIYERLATFAKKFELTIGFSGTAEVSGLHSKQMSCIMSCSTETKHTIVRGLV